MSHTVENEVVILAGARTPMGSFQGQLKALSATALGAYAIKSAVERAGIAATDVQEVIMGNVLSAGLKQGPARQASRQAGLADTTGCTTINKLCGSGMKAVMLAHDLIKAGTNQIMIAGGMESMSNAPYLLLNARSGYRMGHRDKVIDHLFFDGLEDAETGRLMGTFAQDTADCKGLTREDMDAFAIGSLTRAQTAIKAGALTEETIAVEVSSRKGTDLISHDEQPFNAHIEKIPQLKPVFSDTGTITAANASSISDGASALVLMHASTARERGLKPMARIVAHSTYSQHPSEFTTAPVGAIKALLTKLHWSVKDVDLFEINEAFAMVAMIPIIELGLDSATVNIHGGACAQGHPIGSTGSRLIVTLMYALKNKGLKRGVAALCIGGGEATAIAIERL